MLTFMLDLKTAIAPPPKKKRPNPDLFTCKVKTGNAHIPAFGCF